MCIAITLLVFAIGILIGIGLSKLLHKYGWDVHDDNSIGGSSAGSN